MKKLDINKIIAWMLTFIMTGAAAKLWSDLDFQITIGKSKDDAITQALDLLYEEQKK